MVSTGKWAIDKIFNEQSVTRLTVKWQRFLHVLVQRLFRTATRIDVYNCIFGLERQTFDLVSVCNYQWQHLSIYMSPIEPHNNIENKVTHTNRAVIKYEKCSHLD